jgi:hypothetical protein
MKKYLACLFLFFVIEGTRGFAQEAPAQLDFLPAHATYSPEEAWKYKRLYLGMRPAGSVHFYDTRGTQYSGVSAQREISLDFAMQAAVQLYEFFAVQTELMVTEDAAVISLRDQQATSYKYNTDYVFRSRSLIVPLLAKATLRPGMFSLAGFGGLYVSFPISQVERYSSFSADSRFEDGRPLFGFTVGGSAGLGSRDGILFLDIRYMRDFGKTRFEGNAYGRSMVSVGIGFEVGLF